MPAYDYKCEKCGIIKEVIHGMLDEPVIVCDKCGNHMKKVITGGTGVIYKVEGFSKWRGMKH